MTMQERRPNLGEYFSVGCTKYLFEGIEDTLGTDGAEVIYQLAGRRRGRELAQAGGVAGTDREQATGEAFIRFLMQTMKDERLCIIENVDATSEEGVATFTVAETLEGATAQESAGRRAMFTAGVMAGIAEAVMNLPYQAEQVSADGSRAVLKITRMV